MSEVHPSRLTVISERKEAGRSRVLCRCQCGIVREYSKYNVSHGRSRSCGCLKRRAIGQAPAPEKTERPKKDRGGGPLRHIWRGVIDRCDNPKNSSYRHYGGRGIRVCDRWRDSFRMFAADVGERPPGTELDRIDNDGNYEPGNVRWATKSQNSRNRRDNHLITHLGATRTIVEWAEITGLRWVTIYQRIHRGGWSVDRALTTAAKIQAKPPGRASGARGEAQAQPSGCV